MRHTDYCAFLCCVLATAGEGATCFLAVSDARPYLRIEILEPKTKSVRSGLTAAATRPQKETNQQMRQNYAHIFTPFKETQTRMK